MNLQPITEAERIAFSFICRRCFKPCRSDQDREARADLDGAPFRAYYCGACVAKIVGCFAEVAQRALAFLRIGWHVRSHNAGVDQWVLFAPHAGGNAVWIVTENGGEVNVWKPNTDVCHTIPYTAERAPMVLNAATMAYRIACPIFGNAIDWNDRMSDEDFKGLTL